MEEHKCAICEKEIYGSDLFRCKLCKKTHCSEHRLPEDHKCSRLTRNPFNLIKEKQDPNIIDSHKLIVEIFNPEFNKFISKHIKEKKYGTIRTGGIKEIALTSKDDLYKIAQYLINLREYFINRKEVYIEDLKDYVDKLKVLSHYAKYDQEYNEAVYNFITELNKEYNLNISTEYKTKS